MCELFAEHRQNLYRFMPVNEVVIGRACEYIERHPLRASDALHLATALEANRKLLDAGKEGLVFLCADDRLINAATAEGLVADNPNSHA
jgi:predicted nucleic acid-binding protein